MEIRGKRENHTQAAKLKIWMGPMAPMGPNLPKWAQWAQLDPQQMGPMGPKGPIGTYNKWAHWTHWDLQRYAGGQVKMDRAIYTGNKYGKILNAPKSK